MTTAKEALSSIKGIRFEMSKEKTPTGDDYYYHFHAILDIEGENLREVHQSFTRETFEDDFESRFNIIFDLIRRRFLTIIAEKRGIEPEDPFYGVTFGAKRDQRGILVQDENDR